MAARAERAFALETNRPADATVAVATDGDAVRVVATATVGLSLLRLVRGAAPFSLRVTAVARPHRVP